MSLRRTSHVVYDAFCRLVWAPKYRKWVLRGDIRDRTQGLFQEIGERHDIGIDLMEVASDHIHLFVSFPPRLSISEVVGKLKAISAKVLFEEFPEVKRELCGGEFWEDGYFACTVGRDRGSDSQLYSLPR
jgi:putative transposase